MKSRNKVHKSRNRANKSKKRSRTHKSRSRGGALNNTCTLERIYNLNGIGKQIQRGLSCPRYVNGNKKKQYGMFHPLNNDTAGRIAMEAQLCNQFSGKLRCIKGFVENIKEAIHLYNEKLINKHYASDDIKAYVNAILRLQKQLPVNHPSYHAINKLLEQLDSQNESYRILLNYDKDC